MIILWTSLGLLAVGVTGTALIIARQIRAHRRGDLVAAAETAGEWWNGFFDWVDRFYRLAAETSSRLFHAAVYWSLLGFRNLLAALKNFSGWLEARCARLLEDRRRLHFRAGRPASLFLSGLKKSKPSEPL